MGAAAADIPVKALVLKAPPASAFSWSGCYLGGSVGYAWGRDQNDETDMFFGGIPSATTPLDSAKLRGLKAGGFAGCNWQWAPAYVIGVEADLERANVKGGAEYATFPPPDFYESRISTQGSVRARLGYSIGHTMAYATAGVAFARVTERYVDGFFGDVSEFATTRSGWTAGVGLEHAFTSNWLGRIEYRYADFGRFQTNPDVYFGFLQTHRITGSALRLGLAYKWDAPGVSAADAYAAAPRFPAAVKRDWTGWYIGLGLGARAMHSDWITTAAFDPDGFPIPPIFTDPAASFSSTAFRIGGMAATTGRLLRVVWSAGRSMSAGPGTRTR